MLFMRCGGCVGSVGKLDLFYPPPPQYVIHMRATIHAAPVVSAYYNQQ
jgi:hypothetical protein